MYSNDIEKGIVAVYRTCVGNSYAVCSCGWSGSQRLLKAAACQDAWAHAAQNHCEVHFPLVIPAARRRRQPNPEPPRHVLPPGEPRPPQSPNDAACHIPHTDRVGRGMQPITQTNCSPRTFQVAPLQPKDEP
jgi:hypothetical protein